MPDRIAFLPLDSYPEPATDAAILAALAMAAALGCKADVSTFAVDVPPVAAPIGGYLMNLDSMARAAEDSSRATCARLHALVTGAPDAAAFATVTTKEVIMGATLSAAATKARQFDLSILPWTSDSLASQDMAQSLVFESGRPVILVPAQAQPVAADHIAIAWDESRVAARALGDALALLAPGGRITVLTVKNDKPLTAGDPAQTLAASLRQRGYDADSVDLALDGLPVAGVLQTAALTAGARLLAMGGYGHSRLRDFILGGATKGVLSDLRLPVLLSH